MTINIEKMLSVYFIAGTQDIISGNLPDFLEKALKSGISCFQYREKGKNSLQNPDEIEAMARKCQALCRAYDVPFIINDDVELALKINADGIHVGQKDSAIEQVILQCQGKIIGLSCHDEEEIERANQLSEISYYGLGPVFSTISKADAEPAIGLENLQKLTEIARPPVVAIGGISEQNAKEVLATGVAGLSVISALTRSENLSRSIEQLKNRSV